MNEVNLKYKMIIPAAGFGRRMGSPEVKELLHDECGHPLIDHAVSLAVKMNISFHIISRPGKIKLKNYLESKSYLVKTDWTYQEIESSKEWPDSVLQAKPFWGDRNVLVLPDTRWEPVNIVEKVLFSNQDLSLAVFSPPDLNNWGVIDQIRERQEVIGLEKIGSSTDKILRTQKRINHENFQVTQENQIPNSINKDKFNPIHLNQQAGQQIPSLFDDNSARQLVIADKPIEWSDKAVAWGLIGFRREVGESVFQSILDSYFDKKFRNLPQKTELFELKKFRDLGRGPVKKQ